TGAVTREEWISSRYLAKVAALSELPRAQVTAKGGGAARSRAPRSRQSAALPARRRATTWGASRASCSMAVFVASESFLSGIIVPGLGRREGRWSARRRNRRHRLDNRTRCTRPPRPFR